MSSITYSTLSLGSSPPLSPKRQFWEGHAGDTEVLPIIGENQTEGDHNAEDILTQPIFKMELKVPKMQKITVLERSKARHEVRERRVSENMQIRWLREKLAGKMRTEKMDKEIEDNEKEKKNVKDKGKENECPKGIWKGSGSQTNIRARYLLDEDEGYAG